MNLNLATLKRLAADGIDVRLDAAAADRADERAVVKDISRKISADDNGVPNDIRMLDGSAIRDCLRSCAFIIHSAGEHEQVVKSGGRLGAWASRPQVLRMREWAGKMPALQVSASPHLAGSFLRTARRLSFKPCSAA